MFGYVTASWSELDETQKKRYNSIYCGICRAIRQQSSQPARLTLSFDMAFLATLLMSLYEPEETAGSNRCMSHPIHNKDWVQNECIQYGADMNVALSYYKCLDDWHDDKKLSAKIMAQALQKHCKAIENRYPRQCKAISDCITELSLLESANCPNPDEPANCFGRLMAELLVYKEDLWADTLRQMGFHLGRYIYLADAAIDYRRDKKHGKYNPYLAMGSDEDWPRWEEYLVLAMGRCTDAYERLPLVQDKALLDNILYSGIWVNFRGKGTKAREET